MKKVSPILLKMNQFEIEDCESLRIKFYYLSEDVKRIYMYVYGQ